MNRRFDPDHTTLPIFTRATEHSTPFSDLTATPDVRRMRLWFATEIDETALWRPLDIARGGLSTANLLRAAEHNNTRQSDQLLRRVALSAFVLFQADKLTDDDGNLAAIALPRNTSVQLGQMMRGHFDVLRGGALSANHVGLHVDDNDRLAIEAHDIDNLPQIEVITADDEEAVQIGLATRNYVFADDIGMGDGGITVLERHKTIEPLDVVLATIPPQESSADDAPVTITPIQADNLSK